MAYKPMKNMLTDPYIDQLFVLRQDVLNRFATLYQTLKLRETEIFAEIDRLENEYRAYYSESESKLKEFHKMKKYADETIKDNETQSRFLAYIDANLDRIRNTQKDLSSWSLPSVKWGHYGYEGIQSLISRISIDLSESDRSLDSQGVVDLLSSKKLPISRGGRIGSAKKFGELVHPNHIAVDHASGNIYVADSKKHCVHAFSREAKYLHAVPHDFRSPRAVCCKGEQLYVVENDFNSKHIAFKVLSIDGTVHCQAVVKFGKEVGEFRIVPSFDVSANEEWFVCDLKASRVQVFSSKLQFLGVFGNARLHAPTSIRVKMSEIFVLESPTYDIAPMYMKGGCSVKVFSENGDLLYSVPVKDVKEAWYFDVNVNSRIVVSDFFGNCIRVLDKSGELLLKIGGKGNKEVKLNQPKGVLFTLNGDILSVCMNENGCLQLF